MRHLLTSLALLATFAAAAQSTMPWNPDANDDSYVGASDMLSTLAVYGQQVGIDSSLTCEYDGTPIEEFWGNVWNGDIIIDSMLVQYHTIDSAQVFTAGCPEPLWETVSYERAWMTDTNLESTTYMYWRVQENGFTRYFFLSFNSASGKFDFRIQDNEVNDLGLVDVLGAHVSHSLTSNGDGGSPYWSIPFPIDAASFDESGIQFEFWDGFLNGATYVNILPYWHYAE